MRPPQFVEKVCFFKKVLVLNPYPQTPFPGKGAECGAAALTKQGRLQSVAHSRCTMQRHQRLTTRIGATPKARMLWLLAKSFARCKTNRASNAKHPFSKIYRFFDRLERRFYEPPLVFCLLHSRFSLFNLTYKCKFR